MLFMIFLFQGKTMEERAKKNVHLLDETLFISSFSDDDNGNYACVVTNQAGTATSNSFPLFVIG